MEAFVSEYSELQLPSGEQCGGDQAEDIRVSGTAGKGDVARLGMDVDGEHCFVAWEWC